MAIRSAAVLGAGVMGAQIAAHFANVGVPVLLMDLTAEAAAAGLKRATGLTPDPFFTKDAVRLIETTGFDDGMTRLAEADWIVEAVVERLDVKTRPPGAGGRAAPARFDRQLQHVGHPDRGAGRGAKRQLQAPLAGHALLQSPPLPASARGDPDRTTPTRPSWRA